MAAHRRSDDPATAERRMAMAAKSRESSGVAAVPDCPRVRALAHDDLPSVRDGGAAQQDGLSSPDEQPREQPHQYQLRQEVDGARYCRQK
jgi:hypothetical protein